MPRNAGASARSGAAKLVISVLANTTSRERKRESSSGRRGLLDHRIEIGGWSDFKGWCWERAGEEAKGGEEGRKGT
jgi:hypothetical protein